MFAVTLVATFIVVMLDYNCTLKSDFIVFDWICYSCSFPFQIMSSTTNKGIQIFPLRYMIASASVKNCELLMTISTAHLYRWLPTPLLLLPTL